MHYIALKQSISRLIRRSAEIELHRHSVAPETAHSSCRQANFDQQVVALQKLLQKVAEIVGGSELVQYVGQPSHQQQQQPYATPVVYPPSCTMGHPYTFMAANSSQPTISCSTSTAVHGTNCVLPGSTLNAQQEEGIADRLNISGSDSPRVPALPWHDVFCYIYSYCNGISCTCAPRIRTRKCSLFCKVFQHQAIHTLRQPWCVGVACCSQSYHVVLMPSVEVVQASALTFCV